MIELLVAMVVFYWNVATLLTQFRSYRAFN